MQDDLLHFFCTPEGLVGAAKAYRDAGLRAFITVTSGTGRWLTARRARANYPHRPAEAIKMV